MLNKEETVNHKACIWLKFRHGKYNGAWAKPYLWKLFVNVFKPVSIKYLRQIYIWSYHGNKRILSSMLSYGWFMNIYNGCREESSFLNIHNLVIHIHGSNQYWKLLSKNSILYNYNIK